MDLLLYAPEYRPNLSNMIRSAEFFGWGRIYIFDKNQLLAPPKNKASRADMNHMARVWTAGAIDHITIEPVADIDAFMSNYSGRKIATWVTPDAIHLDQFSFEPTDLLIMGSEKEGLPKAFANQCDSRLYIPGSGVTDCLNVSVSLGIFLYAAQLSGVSNTKSSSAEL